MFDLERKFRFRSFPVYHLILSYCAYLREAARIFPETERYGLTSQLFRAGDSIALNLAEGSGRPSDKEFARFISIAIASLYETVACFDIALRLGYLSEEAHFKSTEHAAEIGNQMSAFRKMLVKSKKSKVKSAISSAIGARYCR